MFYSLYKNIELIKDLYKKIILDNTIKEYLEIYEKDILQMNDFCDNLINFMNDNLNIELTKDLDLFQNFELNFIKRGVDA